MKRSLILLLTAVLIALFAWAWTSSMQYSQGKSQRESARTIVPSLDKDSQTELKDALTVASYDESRLQPLVPLENDETFLQAVAADLDKDGTADQICAVKRINEQTITLVPGVQNPITGEYARMEAIPTGVTLARTLLFYTLDIIGDRRQAIVYSGMNGENLQVLAVYLPAKTADGKLSYTAVADLRSDGNIAIQEIPRSDAYNLGVANGESYPIHTFNSDPESPQSLNQIERVYRWNRVLNRYEKASESRIEGKKIETRLIQKLQGGDLASFEDFLDGLWYVPASGKAGEEKFIFFNSKQKEIIFHNGTTEEVFFRESGAARRYGIYLTTRNQSISSIRRLIDIELTGIDEIKIKVQEDVKLKIGVASVWDGAYRKKTDPLALQDSQKGDEEMKKLSGALASWKGEWKSQDGQAFSAENDAYRLTKHSGRTEEGNFVVLRMQNNAILQLRQRDSGNTSFFAVGLEYAKEGDPIPQTMTLTEVKIGIGTMSLTGNPPIAFRPAK